MDQPEINRICWLFKKNNGMVNIVGFLRDHQDGCLIIGGETGSHYSGHGENWKSKWKQYLQQDFVTQEMAISKKLIERSWSPPSLSKSEQEILNKIKKGLK